MRYRNRGNITICTGSENETTNQNKTNEHNIRLFCMYSVWNQHHILFTLSWKMSDAVEYIHYTLMHENTVQAFRVNVYFISPWCCLCICTYKWHANTEAHINTCIKYKSRRCKKREPNCWQCVEWLLRLSTSIDVQ